MDHKLQPCKNLVVGRGWKLESGVLGGVWGGGGCKPAFHVMQSVLVKIFLLSLYQILLRKKKFVEKSCKIWVEGEKPFVQYTHNTLDSWEEIGKILFLIAQSSLWSHFYHPTMLMLALSSSNLRRFRVMHWFVPPIR